MTTRPRAAISWSGGKDSCAALQPARAAYDIVAMVTMFDDEAARSRSHGLRPEVLAAQAARLGRSLSRELLPELVRRGFDPCGERGEYHTVVTNSPLFNSPLVLRHLDHVQRSGCWALDLGVDDAAGA